MKENKVIHYLNVCDMDGSKIGPVDVITFGSPCQDMSIAGKREGLKHSEQGDDETTRSGLFFEAIRIIKEMRKATNGEYPKYAVWENVPGAFSSNKGRDFLAVLEAICSVCDSAVSIPKPYDTKKPDKLRWNGAGEIVGDNYSVCWRTLDAQYWGVPQRRKRIYLVADFNTQYAREISFKPDSLRGDLSQSNEQRKEVTSNVVGSTDGSIGAISVDASHADDVVRCEDTVPSMQARQCKGGNYVCIPAQKNRASCIGFDGYNSNITDDVSATLGVNCGMSSGRNGIIECLETQELFEPKSMLEENWEQTNTKNALRANSSKSSHCIVQTIVLNDQGGSSINVEQSDVAPTLRAQSHQHEPIIAFAQNQRNEVRDLNGKAGALAAEAGVHQQTYICEPTIALQGNGIDRSDSSGCEGAGWREDEMYTLNTMDRHAVCYDMTHACDVIRDCGDVAPTLQNRMGTGGNQVPLTIENAKPPRKYIIRRLIPTECARLQGFPDDWGKLKPFNTEDSEFWESVRKVHAEINGKKYKPCKDVKSLKKWYEKLHNDGSEYKMWGNGIALPCAEYVLHNLSEHGVKTLGSLFDGSGGFPLAGIMNSIVTLWTSEIEPYPIAVTKRKFE